MTYRDLLALVRNTHTFIYLVHVVTDQSISTILRNDTERDKKHKSVSITLGLEEVGVVAGLGDFMFQADCFPDLLIFELDGGIVGVAISVVLGKSCKCLLRAIICNLPSWRFWYPCNGQLEMIFTYHNNCLCIQ